MELESMKSLWEAHDAELKKVSSLSDQLLGRIIREKSHHSLEKIKNTEYFMAALTLLFLIVFLLMVNQLSGLPEMIVSYAITVGAFVITLAWGIYKLAFLSRIDISAGTVTETASKARRFQLLIIRERLISIPSLFIIAPAAYILVFQWVRHRSALEFPGFSLTEVAIVLALAIVFFLVIYRRVYLNRLRSIIASLKEIEDFRKEGKAFLMIGFLFLCGPAITKTTAATGSTLLKHFGGRSAAYAPFIQLSVSPRDHYWPGAAQTCFLEGGMACLPADDSPAEVKSAAKGNETKKPGDCGE